MRKVPETARNETKADIALDKKSNGFDPPMSNMAKAAKKKRLANMKMSNSMVGEKGGNYA